MVAPSVETRTGTQTQGKTGMFLFFVFWRVALAWRLLPRLSDF
jgi:hypothetical protein